MIILTLLTSLLLLICVVSIRWFQNKKEKELRRLHQEKLALIIQILREKNHQLKQPLHNLSLINQIVILKYNKGQLNDTTIEAFKENSQEQIKEMSAMIDGLQKIFESEEVKV